MSGAGRIRLFFFRAANGLGRARTSSRARLYSTTSRIFPPVVTLTSSSSAGSDGDGASTLTYLSMSDDDAASDALRRVRPRLSSLG